MTKQYLVAMVGAREHYGVPRLLHHLARLGTLVTDAWNPFPTLGKSLEFAMPSTLRRLRQRYHEDLPPDRVRVQPWSLLYDPRFNPLRERLGVTRLHMLQGAAFSSGVARRFGGVHDGCVAFCGAALEVVSRYLELGKIAVVDAFDPGEIAAEIVARERQRRPGWETFPVHDHQPLWERRRREYDLAHGIIVNSKWTQRCLVDIGVDSHKIHVVPLFFESSVSAPARRRPSGDLKVLWVGRVSLHKGIGYLLDVARSLAHERIRFDVVGTLAISSDIVASAPTNVRFYGQVSREEVTRFYRSADVFVLPTLSDGFAITQLEAHAQGLPVIVTTRAGEVVVQRETGLVVEPESVEALREAFAWCLDHRGELSEMSAACVERAADFSLSRVAQTLDSALVEVERASRDGDLIG